jgi:DNA-directed RNA polymerase specialized sigma24 family protein
MDERELLAQRFEAHRAHLRGVAYRMLGSAAEADDAVQESWLRMSRAGAGGVDNLGGWMTTVVGRVCLDMLRARGARREETLGLREPGQGAGGRHGHSPEEDVELADSVGGWRCWSCWRRWSRRSAWHSCSTTCSTSRSTTSPA